MAMELTPTTELEAVNEMLGTIGESPVSSLDDVTSVDTAIARTMLRATCRAVQNKGWWFNEDEAYTFTLDTEGRVTAPQQILSLRPARGGALLTQRAGRVWDIQNKTDVFTVAPVADVVWFFDFETLPESARRYIAIRAARLFQTKVLGSETQDVFTEEDERDAYFTFAAEHNDFTFARGHNIFTDATSVSDIWDV